MTAAASIRDRRVSDDHERRRAVSDSGTGRSVDRPRTAVRWRHSQGRPKRLLGWRPRRSGNYLRRIGDEDADLGAMAGVVMFIGGGFILLDFLADAVDVSLDLRAGDVCA